MIIRASAALNQNWQLVEKGISGLPLISRCGDAFRMSKQLSTDEVAANWGERPCGKGAALRGDSCCENGSRRISRRASRATP